MGATVEIGPNWKTKVSLILHYTDAHVHRRQDKRVIDHLVSLVETKVAEIEAAGV